MPPLPSAPSAPCSLPPLPSALCCLPSARCLLCPLLPLLPASSALLPCAPCPLFSAPRSLPSAQHKAPGGARDCKWPPPPGPRALDDSCHSVFGRPFYCLSLPFTAFYCLLLPFTAFHCLSWTYPLPFVDLSLPFVDLSLPFVDLSLPFVDFSMPFVDLSMPFADLSLPFVDLSMPFYTVFRSTATPAAWRACGARHITQRAEHLGFFVKMARITSGLLLNRHLISKWPESPRICFVERCPNHLGFVSSNGARTTSDGARIA